MAAFVSKPTATIKANYLGSSDGINLGGVNPNVDTQETAATQINKVLAVVGKSVTTDKMTLTIVKEGADE